MAGNSWEWVQDWYHASYDGAPGEGTAWESPSSGQRVLRGGAWGVEGALAGTTTRHCSEPGNRGNYHGFRPARWGLDKNAAP
jgi:formylglycine-generating enzyme required for sulfatase activity